jgi:hypothetical protein
MILKTYQETKDADLALKKSFRTQRSLEITLLQALKHSSESNSKSKFIDALNKVGFIDYFDINISIYVIIFSE